MIRQLPAAGGNFEEIKEADSLIPLPKRPDDTIMELVLVSSEEIIEELEKNSLVCLLILKSQRKQLCDEENEF